MASISSSKKNITVVFGENGTEKTGFGEVKRHN